MPDSGVPAAIGYAQAAAIPYELGIIRNHYVGRTFIQPTQSIRELGVRLKHNANRAVVAGKRIVLIDDSLVRGTTSVKIVQMMREAGAKEVHFRIASPPITHPDFYGIDTPERDKLLAATHSVEEMRQIIGADTLAFLSVDGIYRAMGEERRDPVRPQFTDHCFTGEYPTPLTDRSGEAPSPRQLSLLGGGELRAWPVSPAGSLPAPLTDRIALVTGASRGIGAATALALGRMGAHVVAVARTVGGLEELDDAIRAAGGTATLVPLDLTDTDGIIRLAAALHERYRRLDILIGNAGLVGPSSPLDHVQPKDWDQLMAVNVTANWHLIRAMNATAAQLRRRTGGVHLLRRRPQHAGLSRTLFGVQGGAGSAGPHLCGGDGIDCRCASTSSIPGRPAPACAPRSCPARTR